MPCLTFDSQNHVGLVGLCLTKSATACFEDFPQWVQAILVTGLDPSEVIKELLASLILALKLPKPIFRVGHPTCIFSRERHCITRCYALND
jgi:hypothetical protein